MENRTIEISIIATTLAICSCCGTAKNNESASAQPLSTPQTSSALPKKTSQRQYSGIYYERKGGGNIGYEITMEGDSLRVQVKQMNFRPAELTFSIGKNKIDSSALSLMDSLLMGEVNLGEPDTTPKKGSIMMRGTWTYAYLLQDSTKTPIYGKEIIETIGSTEELVRSEIGALTGE